MKTLVTQGVLFGLLVVVLTSDAGGAKFCSWWSQNNLKCRNDEFRCFNGEKCISHEDYCNNIDNCGDNSDERYCSLTICPENFFKCGDIWSQKCIPKDWVCNGNWECPDESDEDNCGHTLRLHAHKVNGMSGYAYRATRSPYSTTRSPYSPQTQATVVPTELSKTAANNVKQWVNNQRKELISDEKWGSNVDRLALTLYLADDSTFMRSLPIKPEMTYELKIQLLSRLSSMKLEDIPSTELASYVNAFLITCVNPRKFHGHDIVKELRNRINNENYSNPYVLLALCNAGETITESDKTKLIDTFENRHRKFWTGMQAVVVMALACAKKQPGNTVDTEVLHKMALELKQRQYRNGTVVNLPTTALVMQALISIDSESDPDNFDERKAFQELLRNQKSDGSFGDLMNTFLITPVLSCKSLVDINSTHCQYSSTDEMSALQTLSRSNGTKKRVHYSIWIGNNKDLERNLILRVPENMSLYSVMETAAELDTRFKFEISVEERKPYIDAISGLRDNPLTGNFWYLYAVQNEEHKFSDESPADIIPKDNDHYVMWYRRGTWIEKSS